MPRNVMAARKVLLVGLAAASLVSITPEDATNSWNTLSNRAGWRIKYPRSWEVGSCTNCPDLTDPDVFVNFFDPKTKAIIVIQHLRDKPPGQSVETWLNTVKQKVVASSRLSEQWMSLDGARALKVVTRNSNNLESENIYVVVGDKTFFLQASPIGDEAFYQTYKQMLSTFKFTKR